MKPSSIDYLTSQDHCCYFILSQVTISNQQPETEDVTVDPIV